MHAIDRTEIYQTTMSRSPQARGLDKKAAAATRTTTKRPMAENLHFIYKLLPNEYTK